MYANGNPNLPTKEDFDGYDMNADGIVTFEELIQKFDEELQIAEEVMANADHSE